MLEGPPWDFCRTGTRQEPWLLCSVTVREWLARARWGPKAGQPRETSLGSASSLCSVSWATLGQLLGFSESLLSRLHGGDNDGAVRHIQGERASKSSGHGARHRASHYRSLVLCHHCHCHQSSGSTTRVTLDTLSPCLLCCRFLNITYVFNRFPTRVPTPPHHGERTASPANGAWGTGPTCEGGGWSLTSHRTQNIVQNARGT